MRRASGEEKGARSKTTQGEGDEVGRPMLLTSIGLNLRLDCRLSSRMAIWPRYFAGIEEKNTPKSEQLLRDIVPSFRRLVKSAQ